MITLEEIKAAREAERAARIAETDWRLVWQQLLIIDAERCTLPTDRAFIEHLKATYLRTPLTDSALDTVRRMHSYEMTRLKALYAATAYDAMPEQAKAVI